MIKIMSEKWDAKFLKAMNEKNEEEPFDEDLKNDMKRLIKAMNKINSHFSSKTTKTKK